MSTAKTRYMIIDWDEHETHIFDDKAEMDKWLNDVSDSQDWCDGTYCEDMEMEILKLLPASKPKKMICQMSLNKTFDLSEG